MKKELLSLFLVCIIISVVEIGYIHSAGQVGIIEGTPYWESSGFFIQDFESKTNFAKILYDFRPYKNDFNGRKPLISLMYVGYDTLLSLVDIGRMLYYGGLSPARLCNESILANNPSWGEIVKCREDRMSAAIATNFVSTEADSIKRFIPDYASFSPTVTLNEDYHTKISRQIDLHDHHKLHNN